MLPTDIKIERQSEDFFFCLIQVWVSPYVSRAHQYMFYEKGSRKIVIKYMAWPIFCTTHLCHQYAVVVISYTQPNEENCASSL